MIRSSLTTLHCHHCPFIVVVVVVVLLSNFTITAMQQTRARPLLPHANSVRWQRLRAKRLRIASARCSTIHKSIANFFYHTFKKPIRLRRDCFPGSAQFGVWEVPKYPNPSLSWCEESGVGLGTLLVFPARRDWNS